MSTRAFAIVIHRDSGSVLALPSPALAAMDQADIPAMLNRLASSEAAIQKMAVFKLQSSINDPSFADIFISSGGLLILRRLIMNTSGNTLAYSLQCLSRLLEVDMGFEIFENAGAGELVERIVELIITNPLVNILRGAMAILVSLVGHAQSVQEEEKRRSAGAFGFRALKPAVAVYPQFFEMVVSQLSSADHALCGNALALLNALMRDAIVSDTHESEGGTSKSVNAGEDWPKFIKKLQDLGIIKLAYDLMQSSALQDLALPLLDFQIITKLLLRRWKDMPVNLDKHDHRRAMKGLHLASAPEKRQSVDPADAAEIQERTTRKKSTKHAPDKWRRLGFQSESPVWEFEPTGFLGMMDLTDYVRKHEDGYQKILQEQSISPLHERCPLARASLAVTAILCEHFEVAVSGDDDARNYLIPDEPGHYDKIFKPLLLQWTRLHTAGLHAFMKLWKATGAVQDDFDRVAELVRILIEQVVGQAARTKGIDKVEEELTDFPYTKLRELQMELIDLTFEDRWGTHLDQIRSELKHEALQFMKEQRVRCLLTGSWFPRYHSSTKVNTDDVNSVTTNQPVSSWRFAKLSYNRRYLHYSDYQIKLDADPSLDQLYNKIDLSTVSSVVSNVSTAPSADFDATSVMTSSTPKTSQLKGSKSHSTKITINAYIPTSTPDDAFQDAKEVEEKEKAILTLQPQTNSLASEWLDGLLMLLDQAPITAETQKLVNLVVDCGMRVRLLNVDADVGGEESEDEEDSGLGVVPTREGLDDDYYYEV